MALTEYYEVGKKLLSSLPQDPEEEGVLIDDTLLEDILYKMVDAYLETDLYRSNQDLVVNSCEAEGITNPELIARETIKMHAHILAHRLVEFGAGIGVLKGGILWPLTTVKSCTDFAT